MLTTNTQASYNVLYTNITAPYVKTINGLGIPTNSDPVCAPSVLQDSSEYSHIVCISTLGMAPACTTAR